MLLHLQFEDEHHFVVVLERVVQVDQLLVMQLVHNVNLLADQLLLHGMTDRNKLGGEDVSGFAFSASMYHSEGSSACGPHARHWVIAQ
jgi:hypothetical protein